MRLVMQTAGLAKWSNSRGVGGGRLKSQQDIKRMRGNKNKRKQTNKQTSTQIHSDSETVSDRMQDPVYGLGLALG